MIRVDENVYRLKFFNKDFTRRRCVVCGTYFWTKNAKQDHCNDAPCVEYYFWEVPKRKTNLSVAEARKLFIDFFRKNGHEYLEPRPVVARWRDDLYLTIASIVVFQPHVTSGIVPPPANPLVIVQPCIRLEDIDNVGLTMGRHLTSFEMGGHHAFNYPDKEVYWKEETVELAYRFFTEELGVPEDMITLKESWWEGGGNAGPSFEVTIGGLELATLVFMEYVVRDGEYHKMPMKIVDTGYGIERIAWFTQRNAPTAFHAIYGNLVDEFHKLLSIEKPDIEVLWEAARLAGRLDPENPNSINKYYSLIAERTDSSIHDIIDQLSKAASVYALLDHTKTIALMLGDGVVPSNTGEGYLARLVIRRALRIISRLGSDVGLAELVMKQINYWSQDYYPQLARMKDYILTVTSREEERYKKTLETGLKLVERTIRRKRKITLDDLVEIYDSHGISPDIVADTAAKHGIQITVPHDFYAIVARRHGASGGIARTREASKLPSEIVSWASTFKPTKRLFHENPYLREFRATVLGYTRNYLVLDQTAFYPTGGGQLHDTGIIEACGEKYNVINVEKTNNNVIVHVLDRPFKECQHVYGRIDWERRYKLMRHHTAIHILLGTTRRILGEHVWQAGAEKTPEKARIDITHYELPSRDIIKAIEKEANKVIDQDIRINTIYIERNEAEKKYGFKLYQGGAPMDPVIRVVEIPGVDVEACFGTHVAKTSEVGAIKIVNVEKLQDGVIRFEIVAATEVPRHASALEKIIEEASRKVGASPSELVDRISKVVERFEELKRKYSRLKSWLIEQILSQVLKSPRTLGDIKAYLITNELLEEDDYRELLKRITSKDAKSIAIAIWRKDEHSLIELSRGSEAGVDLRELVKLLRHRYGWKGGGKADHITILAQHTSTNDAIEKVINTIEQLLSKS